MRNYKPLALIIAFVLILSLVYANGEEVFLKAEEIIKQKIPCNLLSENQLESIGEFYMEQMHPGELHEIMDERMGGEGSASLRQTHISLAKAFYCGENQMMSVGMMNTMMGRGEINNQKSTTYTFSFPLASMIILGLIFIVLIIIITLLLSKSGGRRKNEK